MKKRLVVAFAAAAIVIVLVAASAINRARRIRIGVLLPLSGPDAAVGLGMRNSIRLAAEQVNRRGGIQGRRVQLVEIDEASNPEKASTGARALRDDKRVVGVIGTYDHDSYVAAQPILGDAKVAFISAGVSDRDRTSVGLAVYPAEFGLLPFGPAQMEHAAKYAWNVLGARSFVYVRDESHFAATTVSHMRCARALEPEAFEKLPAKARREMAQRHEWEVKQLKIQRELALKRTEDEVAAAKKRYEDAKAYIAAEEKRSTDEAMKSCAGSCVQRPPKVAECLQRTQAVEDIESCERL